MRLSDVVRYPVSCLAVAMLAACAARPPMGGAGAMPQTLPSARHAEHGRSWMLAEAKRENLLYVVDEGARDVYVYSYPQRALVGTLGFDYPTGDCVDKAGNVWIDTVQQSGPPVIQEFAHGGTRPIATLDFPDDGDDPTSCSVDRTTGNLAASSFLGTVYVYIKAKGTGQSYGGARWYADAYTAYDDSGNLYVDATVGNPGYLRVALFELKRNDNRYRRLWFRPRLDFSFPAPGGLQWDGEQLAFGEEYSSSGPIVYHVSKHGKFVTLASGTTLSIDASVDQFWIQGKTLIAPYYTSGGGGIAFFTYPAGGSPISTITGLGKPVAATVSLAPKK
jgi:hypothetical protein